LILYGSSSETYGSIINLRSDMTKYDCFKSYEQNFL
jgi:hypothetical protein